jgi:hypothetical protein
MYALALYRLHDVSYDLSVPQASSVLYIGVWTSIMLAAAGHCPCTLTGSLSANRYFGLLQ